MIVWFAALLLLQVDLGDAERALAEGRHGEARIVLEGALLEGDAPAGALLYNLGNVAFLEGRQADAVLLYRRAALRLPGDAELRANLRLTERALGVEDAKEGGVFGRLRALAPLTLLGLACALQLAGVLLLFLAHGGRAARAAGGLCIAVGLALSAQLLHARWREQPLQGVVLARGVLVRGEPHASISLSLSLRAGELVDVAEYSDRWMRVSHARGGGWTERAGVGLVD